MASAAEKRAIVVGGGLAGLMTAIKLCEAGIKTDVFSYVPVKRSHSVCAQGGINASVNTKGEGDSPRMHLEETVFGGDFLANQPPCKGMCDAAPAIVYLLDRMGVPFNRTPEGLLDFRRFGGSRFHRTAHAGATTGQQLLYALDEQVRRFEVEGLVRKFELWEFLSVVLDDHGRARGIVAQDLKSMKIESFPADAVCLATGGPGVVFGKSTNSMINTGTAATALYMQGAIYANGEFIQVHPTAIPGSDKLRLMSESLRGEGGRVWVPKDRSEKRAGRDVPEKDRWYFLEEKYPKYGNLVPRDIASREIFGVCVHQKKGINGRNEVYLDLTHMPEELLRKKLAGVLEIYEKFAGEDPYTNPMRVFPAVHYSMGGLWVDYERGADGGVEPGSPRNQSTSVPGVYATGEVDYQYHGANRLGANSLLSCIYAGMIAGPSMKSYIDSLQSTSSDVSSVVFDRARARDQDEYDSLLKMSSNDNKENPYVIAKELGELMMRDVTVERDNAVLDEADARIARMQERWEAVDMPDRGTYANNPVVFTRQLKRMLVLARVITRGARNRDECRGAHYKPALDPELHAGAVGRDDEKWNRTTFARHTGSGPEFVRGFSYELLPGQTAVEITDALDTSLVAPRARKY